MECSCVRHTDVPGTSKLFADLIYHFDRVEDLYPYRPNDIESLAAAARFDFPDDRRAALVRALTPLNQGNPSLADTGAAGHRGDCDRPAGGPVFRPGLHRLQSADGHQGGARTVGSAAFPPFPFSGWPPRITISPKSIMSGSSAPIISR